MSEEEIIEYFKEVISWHRKNTPDRVYALNNKDIEMIQGLLDLYNKEKEKNKKLEEGRKNGTLSDGFHTYNDLYYQRCVLFATICNMNKEISWKSKRHNDGKKCFDNDDWFIVGIDTPEGCYTYHYEIKYWNLFKVQELQKGKEWDGHTEKDVIRLFSLVDNFISKDKINSKIEEYEEILQSSIIKEDYKKEVEHIIRVLEELK